MPNSRPSFHSQAWARAAGAFAILMGVLVLLGWALDIDVLKSAFPNFAAMRPIAAVSFILCGLALYLNTAESMPSTAGWPATMTVLRP